MNKVEFIDVTTAEFGLSKVDSKKALGAFLSPVTKVLSAGNKISLVGFDTFSVAERTERLDINPSTKEVTVIPTKKVVKFKPGAELVDAIK